MPEAVVTGSSSGIGLCVSRRLVDAGWRVQGLDCAEPWIAPGTNYVHHRIDLVEADVLDALLARLAGGQAPIHALVHAAGIMRDDAHPTTRRDHGEHLWRLHAAVAHRMIEVLAPRMPDGQGRVVLLSSRAARGRSGRALYAGSKAALDGIARSWASTLLPRGIMVNVVAPGATRTAMLEGPERSAATVMQLPIGRLIEPDEVADVVELLLGRAGAVITGQTILLDAGVSLVG